MKTLFLLRSLLSPTASFALAQDRREDTNSLSAEALWRQTHDAAAWGPQCRKPAIFMLVRLFVGLVAIFLTHSFAPAAVMRASNSPVYIVITAAFSTNATNEVQFNEKLEWSAFSDTNAFDLNYPKPRYGIKISMTGPDGHLVQKTSLGKTYGTDFDAATHYEDTISGWSMGSMTAAWPYKGGPVGGISFPAARDLFEMKTPGDYTMTVQMKMFRIDKHPNGDWTRKMLLFSPATIKVVKP